MKPSDIILFRAALPLIDTFGRAEREFAAALMVRACLQNGDTWQTLTPPQIGFALKADLVEGGVWERLKTNPIMPQADMRDLVAKGFAEFLGDPDGEVAAPIQFTPKGLEALQAKATREGLQAAAEKRNQPAGAP